MKLDWIPTSEPFGAKALHPKFGPIVVQFVGVNCGPWEAKWVENGIVTSTYGMDYANVIAHAEQILALNLLESLNEQDKIPSDCLALPKGARV